MTDGMGRNGSQIKRRYVAIEEGPKGGRRGESFTHLESETSGDESSRVALSVFSCVLACGECGPVRLRGSQSVQLQTRQRWT